MKVLPTELPDVLIVEPTVFKDTRGFFLEAYRQDVYARAGIDAVFVQDNSSRSVQGTLRGLHAQLARPQGKLVRVVEGEIFDVIVDIRRGSPTYKKWVGVRISASDFRQIWIPAGFAHGFLTLSAEAEVDYKVTDFYDPAGELRLLWNDPDIGIQWPAGNYVISEKDRAAKRLRELEPTLPLYRQGF